MKEAVGLKLDKGTPRWLEKASLHGGWGANGSLKVMREGLGEGKNPFEESPWVAKGRLLKEAVGLKLDKGRAN